MSNIQVFIPTYNRSKLLLKAIESVQKQSYKNIEIIVLDNFSNDNTQDIVNKIIANDSRLKYIRNNENIGIIGNFNSIAQHISAQYFCVLTDDDVYECDFLTAGIQLLQENPIASAAIFNAPTRINGIIIKSQLSGWSEGIYSPYTALPYCLKQNHPILTNCLFKKEIVSIFNFEPILGGSADIFFFIKLFANYSTVVSKKVTGYYDLHESNETIKNKGVVNLRQAIYLKKIVESYLNNISYDDYSLLIPSWYASLSSLIYHSKTGKELFQIRKEKIIIDYYGKIFEVLLRILSRRHLYSFAKVIIIKFKNIKNLFFEIIPF